MTSAQLPTGSGGRRGRQGGGNDRQRTWLERMYLLPLTCLWVYLLFSMLKISRVSSLRSYHTGQSSPALLTRGNKSLWSAHGPGLQPERPQGWEMMHVSAPCCCDAGARGLLTSQREHGRKPRRLAASPACHRASGARTRPGGDSPAC